MSQEEKLWKVLNMKKNSELFFSKTRDFLTLYLVKQCNKSVHTVKSYKDTLTVFRRFIGEVENISIKTFKFSDCKRELLLRFIEYLRNAQAAVSTINNKLAGIRAYLWYCSDEDVELQPIAIMASRIPFLKETKLIRPIISPEIMTDFLSGSFSHTSKSKRDQLLLMLLYQTAGRASEITAIKIKDIILSERTILFHGKGDKERIVTYDEVAALHLKAFLKTDHKNMNPDDYLFFTKIKGVKYQMSLGNVERIVNKYAELIKEQHPELPESVYPHMFRRTRATNLYQDGVDLELISRYMGHSSTVTTRIYAQPSMAMLKEIMDRANPFSEYSSDRKDEFDNLTENDIIEMCGLRP